MAAVPDLHIIGLMPLPKRSRAPQRPLLPQEVLVKDFFTGNIVCAEFRHEKIRTKGKGDRFKVYHPLFGTQGFRWVRHQNFNVLGMAASEQDAVRHAQQHDLGGDEPESILGRDR